MKKVQNRYNIGDIITPNYGILYVNEKKYIQLKNYKRFGYNVTCKICGYTFDILESTINQNGGCSVCSNHKTLAGYNSMWDTDPDMAKMLLDVKNGYIYKAQSNKKMDWKCPTCGEIIANKSPATVKSRGLSCKNCSDGVSYPNKFIYSVLKQINIDFEREKIFDWAIDKKYDVYIPNVNTIIEMHGLQHYENKMETYDNVRLYDVQKNDKHKEELAKTNGITNYIIIDASYSKCEYLRNSIVRSNLFKILGIEESDIDWSKCDLSATRSIISDIVDYWNCGFAIHQIATRLQLSKVCIIKYLHKGNYLGLCEYTEEESRRRGRLYSIENRKVKKNGCKSSLF